MMLTCFLLSGERQVQRIRELYFKSLLSQEPGWFDLQKAGALTQRLHGDTQVIYKGIAEQAGFFFMHTTTLFAAYVVGFISSWRLTLVLLASSPALILAGFIISKVLTARAQKTRTAYASAGACAEESLTAIRTVHAFNAHKVKLREFRGHLQEALDASKMSGFIQGVGIGAALFLVFCTYSLAFYYASYLIKWRLNTLGEVVTTFFSVIVGTFNVAQGGPSLAAFGEAKAAARGVFAVIDRKPRIHPGTKKLNQLRGDIEFSNLTFRYPSRTERPVFKDLSLKVEAGQTIGLVGLSGCGKSSLVSILQRFYEPADAHFGMRLLDGTTKAYPYESNLVLLEAMQRLQEGNGGCERAELVLPMTADGGALTPCTVVLDTSGTDKMTITHSVPQSDGTVRRDDTGAWYWQDVKDKETAEFRLPLPVCEALNEARDSNEPKVQVDLAFGRFEVDVKAMTRENVPTDVEYSVNGQVYVDGTPLNELDLKWWRDQIGMVTQEPVLFVGTVLENIRAGRPEATMEEVVEACKKANIHHTIVSWPDQYETKVGEGGCQLSGGQKQRIAIARAMIKKARVLLLDEATSALDRESELKVQKALDIVMSAQEGQSKPTTIIIAHRLQTVVAADKIVVMKPPARGQEARGGIIAEQGTHAELVAKEGGIYSSLWNTQNRGVTAQDAAKGQETEEVQEEGQPTADEDEKWELAPVATAEERDAEAAKKKQEKIKNNSSLTRVAALLMPWMMWMVPSLLGCILNGMVYPMYAIAFTEALEVFRKLQEQDCFKQAYFDTVSNTTLYRDVCTDSEYDRDNIDFWCILFVAIGLGGFVGHILQIGGFGYMGEHLTFRIRNMLFAHLLRQDMSFFDEPDHETGALGSILSKHTEVINQLFGPSIGMLLRVLVCLAAGFTIAFIASWKLTLVLLSTVPAMALAGALNIWMLSGTVSETSKGVAGRVTSEAINNFKTVVSFNMGEKMVDEYIGASTADETKKFMRSVGVGLTFGFNQFALFGSFALGLWYGGQLIDDGELDFRDMMLVIMEVTMSSMGVGETAALQGTGMDAKEAAAEVFEILDREPLVDQMSMQGKEGVLTEAELQLKDVTFSYPTRPNIVVLRDFSLTIHGAKEGMQVGLIGGTGSGKSTVMQLLQRFYKLERGQILVDGTDLSDVSLHWWRTQVGVVSQEPMLFGASVLDNIRLGKPDATMDEVTAAAKMANIHHDIEKLPDGYHTDVGTRGSRLSGGQKQRVAIARAMIKKPRILLLDEATSALDNECEKEVQQAIDQIIATNAMTTITIAHKLSTIRDANCITVLDKGQIIEQGTHEDLMQIPNGDYRARFNLYHSLEDEKTPPHTPGAASTPKSFTPQAISPY
eukprot:TRINITY_DN401_c0_g1_i12.p1 TRINITY_DN401_c0_g1~~TRINITY_DN401_c0_g1_i12.p1  ORF type:complete len:1494 (+),score=692.78 TRINITY_DN401_c0_g1_i12:404-4483(+)